MSDQNEAPTPPEAQQFTPPPPAGMPYAPPVPAAAYGAGLALPPGVVLASRGRRIGAWFLSILLSIVTLGIGYLIWGLIVWGKGTSPALQVLGMRVWKPNDGKVAGWGTMALRDILGTLATVILGFITELIAFILFLTDDQNRSLADRVATTIIVHDPNKVLG